MNLVQTTALTAWTSGRRTKKNAKGWISGNAVCCVHNGETLDKRGRGGLLIANNSAAVYKCFNCGYITGWQPGRHLSYKFRKLLGWMGVTDAEIKRLVLVALELKDTEIGEPVEFEPVISFPEASLPDRSVPLSSDGKIYEYLCTRGLTLDDYPFYISPSLSYSLNRRLIIPFFYERKIVGYTARHIGTSKVKYLNEMPHGYVFNLDNQTKDRKIIVVVEGVLDAITIDAVSVIGNEVNDKQIDLIERLHKKIVVVPDADAPGNELVEKALDLGWSVSFPVWMENYKDVNAAALELGRLFTMKTIIDGIEDNPVKIKLLARKFCV